MSRRERQRRRHRSRGGAGRVAFLFLGLLAAVGAIAGLSAIGWVVSVARSAPSIDSLKPKDPGQNSVVYASDGKTRLGIIQARILRKTIPSTSIPDVMKQATVAIEDKRFYRHRGVDFEGVVRAAFKNVQSDQTVQGGSTLTMQLIKNLYTEDRARDGVEGYKRKIREGRLAEELENVHSGPAGKSWILTKYINSVPYGTVGGQEAVGIQAAARVYFNKRAADLTLPEAALLAGLPQAPSLYSPFRSPDAARARRAQVLRGMREMGAITAEEEAKAAASELGLERSTYYVKRRENYFFDYVRKELVRVYGEETVKRGGLRVYTTINLKRQKQARAAIAKNLSAPGSPSSALVSMDPKTGHIKAMASSSNYGDSKFNLAAQGKRQPGSTFKIMALMTALRRNVDLNRTNYVSKKLKFRDPKWGPIEVANTEGGESGKSKSLFQATVSSDNTVFQQLALDLGPEAVKDTAYDMGITSELDGLPAETLGGLTGGVSPLELTRAFVTVNNGGWRTKPVAITKVVFPSGRVDKKLAKPRRAKVFTDGQTLEAVKALKANVEQGTGTSAQLGFCPAAGKTGTTTGYVDAWFAGFTRNLNTTVWVGYPKRSQEMYSVPGWGNMLGGKAPASIWHDYMVRATPRKTCGDWPAAKQPFTPEPFYGTYATKGAPGSAEPSTDPSDPYGAPVTPAAPAGGAGDGGGGGGGGTGGDGGGGAGGGDGGDGGGDGGQAFPPDAYETPPQDAPAAPEAPGDGTSGGAAPG